MAKMGRPTREPTDAEREKVKELLGLGLSVASIAKALEYSAPTFRKYFSREIFAGKKVATPEAPFKITKLHREQVILLVAGKMSIEDVGRVLDLTAEQVAELFPNEIRTGQAKYRATVLGRLDEQSRDGNVSATNRLEALTVIPLTGGEGDANARPGYVGKKVAARAAADAAVSAGGKFAPRSAPRLAVVGGKPVKEPGDE